MTPNPSQAEVRVSTQFDSADSDVTLQSSDGVLFKVHSRNLAAYSEAFPASDLAITANGEVVVLQETSEVLELLLQYMHRRRQPNLGSVSFDMLAALAEAAEKYEVYSAMEVCRIHMKAAVNQHPAEVLAYAGRHDYADLMDEAAPLCILASVDMGRMLSCTTLVAWTRFRVAWQEIVFAAYKSQSPFHHYGTSCVSWILCYASVAYGVAGAPSLLTNGDIFGQVERSLDQAPGPCQECKRCLIDWRQSIETAIRTIPKFSTLR